MANGQKKMTESEIENKIAYLEKFVSKEMNAIPEVVRNQSLAVSSGYIYHAVTPNFIHCEIKTKEKLDLTKEVQVRITGILSERIKKGGDIEVSAEIVKKI